MSLLTFQEARESYELANVLGVCGNSAQAKSYINQGTRILMKRGNFFGTVQLYAGCIFNDCITWPRQVGTELAVNVCGHPITSWNNWGGFIPIGQGGIGAHGFGWDRGRGCCTGNLVVQNYGTAAVFNQVPCGKEYYVRAYPQTRNDIGKKIRIFGIDSNGQVIRTKDANNVLQEGVEIVLAVPFISTPMKIREITRVVKEKTQGVVRLFYYDADNNVLIDSAVYDPTETNPDYRLSKIKGVMRHGGCCACSSGTKAIEALVKLQFVPVEADTDLVLIGNLDALALIIQSIRQGEAGNSDEKRGLEADAIRDLNLELRDKFPVEQTPISINPFGTALPVRHSIGRII